MARITNRFSLLEDSEAQSGLPIEATPTPSQRPQITRKPNKATPFRLSTAPDTSVAYHLPPDVYLEIGSWMRHGVAWSQLTLTVSKRLTALLAKRSKHLLIPARWCLESGAQLNNALTQCLNITSIDVSYSPNLAHVQAFAALRNLTSLDISGCQKLFASWSGSFSECDSSFHPNIRTSLRRLGVNKCDLSYSAVSRIYCLLHNLEVFEMCYSGISEAGVRHLALYGDKLKEWNLSHSYLTYENRRNKNTANTIGIFWTKLTALERLEAVDVEFFFPMAEQWIGQTCTRLRTLKWDRPSSNTIDITRMPHLETLSLKISTADNLEHQLPSLLHPNLTTLKLDVKWHGIYLHLKLLRSLRSLVNLRKLTLGAKVNSNFSAEAIVAIAELCSNLRHLESLSLSTASPYPNAIAEVPWAKSLPSLTRLSLTGPKLFYECFANLPKLRSLKLSSPQRYHCGFDPNSKLFVLAISRFPYLTELSVSEWAFTRRWHTIPTKRQVFLPETIANLRVRRPDIRVTSYDPRDAEKVFNPLDQGVYIPHLMAQPGRVRKPPTEEDLDMNPYWADAGALPQKLQLTLPIALTERQLRKMDNYRYYDDDY